MLSISRCLRYESQMPFANSRGILLYRKGVSSNDMQTLIDKMYSSSAFTGDSQNSKKHGIYIFFKMSYLWY